MSTRDVRDLLEKAQAENVVLRRRVREAEGEITRLAAKLEAAHRETDRLAGLFVKQQVNPHGQKPAFDVDKLVAYLKQR